MIIHKIKEIIKEILPDSWIRSVTGIFYGWSGNFSDWSEAKMKCSGYDSKVILEKVKDSALKVKEGKAVYERDSMIFDEIQYSFGLLSGLMWIAARKGGKINVLDFGGSLGSSYYQNKKFLDSLSEVNWCIVEQPDFVKAGLDFLRDKRLHFFYRIDECMKQFDIDVVLLSSVLQYLENPYSLLNQIKQYNIQYLIIDRTPFIKGKDRITVQKVNPKIYKASYPCWFFNEDSLFKVLSSDYKIVLEFSALDRANVKSKFKGFIFKKAGKDT
jgi:putative methyltransferase (TIGR04325 family)